MMIENRPVYWQIPKSPPPKEGYEVVFFFHDGVIDALEWQAHINDTFGMYYKFQSIKGLLNEGYAVFTPFARGIGDDRHGGEHHDQVWDTDNLQFSTINLEEYQTSLDFRYLDGLIAQIQRGGFPGINFDTNSGFHLFGYAEGAAQASRMAFNWPGLWKSMTLLSGSSFCGCHHDCTYEDLAEISNHPKTRFIEDQSYPQNANSSQEYHDILESFGIVTDYIISDQSGYCEAMPSLILGWLLPSPSKIESDLLAYVWWASSLSLYFILNVHYRFSTNRTFQQEKVELYEMDEIDFSFFFTE